MTTAGPGPAPLAGIRVVECGVALAGAYAGRLLADLGADVVTLEAPPRRDPRRHRLPARRVPLRGEYARVAIVVDGDDEFVALARTIGRPELVADERFATAGGRRRHESELEDIVAQWTSGHDPATAAALLRSAGVTADAVRTMDEVTACSHLAARGFFTTHVHPEAGDRALAGPPWRSSRSPMRAATPAPLLGQHTVQVMRDVLGLGPDEIAELTARGILA